MIGKPLPTPELVTERLVLTPLGAGPSTDVETWYNWIIGLPEHQTAFGFVQATVNARTADLVWVVGTEWQKQGFASEAAVAMLGWLDTQGVEQFSAHIHPVQSISERGDCNWSAPHERDSRWRSCLEVNGLTR